MCSIFPLQSLCQKDYDQFAGIYFTLLEKVKKSASTSHDPCANFPPTQGSSADSEMMETDNEESEEVEKPSMNVPTVQVIPDSPTRRVKPQQGHWDTSQEENEEDDKMPDDILPSLKSYLEKRRHTLTAVDPMMEIPQELREALTQKFIQRPLSPLGQGTEELYPGALGLNPALPPYSPTLDLSLAYKEQILQVPSVFQLRQPLGRRASDGAASLAAGIAQFNALRAMAGYGDDSQGNTGSLSGSPLNSRNPLVCQSPFSVSPGPSSPQISEGANDSGSDQEPDQDAIARYMACRGARQRHTSPNEMPDELQLRLLQVPLKPPRRTVFPPGRERPGREGSFITTPTGIRYNASRRASDGAASVLAYKQHLERISGGGSKRNSLRELQEECLKLQQQYGRVAEEEQQRRQQEQHELHLQQFYSRRASEGADSLTPTLSQFQQQYAPAYNTSQEFDVEGQLRSSVEDLDEAPPQASLALEHQDMLQQEMQRLNIEHCPPAPNIRHSPSAGITQDSAALSSLATTLASNSPRNSLLIEESAPPSSATETSSYLPSQGNTSPFLADGGTMSSPVPSPPASPLISAVPLSQRYPIPNIVTARSSCNRSPSDNVPETRAIPQIPASLPGVMMGNVMVNENDLEELRASWGVGRGTPLLTPTSLLSTFASTPAGALLAGNVGQRSPSHHRRHHTVPSAQDAWNSVDLLRRATANNVLTQNHARDMLNNNINLEEGIRDDLLYRTLSPNGSIYQDSLLKSLSKGDITPDLTHTNNLRMAFCVNMTSNKCIPDIISEIRRSLDLRSSKIAYEQLDQTFTLQQGGVCAEIEVCSLSGNLNGLRLRRVSGNQWQYKKLCNEVLAEMDL